MLQTSPLTLRAAFTSKVRWGALEMANKLSTTPIQQQPIGGLLLRALCIHIANTIQLLLSGGQPENLNPNTMRDWKLAERCSLTPMYNLGFKVQGLGFYRAPIEAP